MGGLRDSLFGTRAKALVAVTVGVVAVGLVVASVAALVARSSTSDWSCPVTTAPESAFVPTGHSERSDGWVWYGDDDLWTIVGGDRGRKSVWWSVHFLGGGLEPTPDVTVAYENLVDGVVIDAWIEQDAGTNAFTADDGHFMIAGHEPDDPGCYRVTGTYRDASLTYVFQVAEPNVAGS